MVMVKQKNMVKETYMGKILVIIWRIARDMDNMLGVTGKRTPVFLEVRNSLWLLGKFLGGIWAALCQEVIQHRLHLVSCFHAFLGFV